jgi:hypothetical protein
MMSINCVLSNVVLGIIGLSAVMLSVVSLFWSQCFKIDMAVTEQHTLDTNAEKQLS